MRLPWLETEGEAVIFNTLLISKVGGTHRSLVAVIELGNVLSQGFGDEVLRKSRQGGRFVIRVPSHVPTQCSKPRGAVLI